LILTSKKYITDQKKLKPSQVRLPHSLLNRETVTVCLIVKDPQRHYKDLVAAASITNTVTKVIGISKLGKKFKSFETRRQLADSHDIFLADDRVVTRLPTTLGATFYRRSSKIPIPVSLARSDSTANLKNQISKALSSTYLHLSPAASTSIRVALSSFSPEQVVENVEKVVKDIVEKKIPGGWKNLKSLHIKSPNSASLPIYMAGEVYGDEDVLKPEEEQKRLMLQAKQAAERKQRKDDKKKKRKALFESKPVDEETTEKETEAGADKPEKRKALFEPKPVDEETTKKKTEADADKPEKKRKALFEPKPVDEATTEKKTEVDADKPKKKRKARFEPKPVDEATTEKKTEVDADKPKKKRKARFEPKPVDEGTTEKKKTEVDADKPKKKRAKVASN
jgi:ribosome biogenesis protein UTP30